jgi:hypothetical protein
MTLVLGEKAAMDRLTGTRLVRHALLPVSLAIVALAVAMVVAAFGQGRRLRISKEPPHMAGLRREDSASSGGPEEDRRRQIYPALRSRAVRELGSILMVTEPTTARAYFTSVFTPRFLIRPDSILAT